MKLLSKLCQKRGSEHAKALDQYFRMNEIQRVAVAPLKKAVRDEVAHFDSVGLDRKYINPNTILERAEYEMQRLCDEDLMDVIRDNREVAISTIIDEIAKIPLKIDVKPMSLPFTFSNLNLVISTP